MSDGKKVGGPYVNARCRMRPPFQIPHGTILYCEQAGVVLQFRRASDGCNVLNVWRLPSAPFEHEEYGLLDDGAQEHHGVYVVPVPTPGPRKVVDDA